MAQLQRRGAQDLKGEIKAIKRERVVHAAAQLFYENGYENTTLDSVGEALGVTKPFIYAHFSSKVELLAEICSRGITSSLQAIDDALAAGNPPTATLAMLGRLFVQAVLDNQMHIAIFAREEKNLLPADFKRISDKRRSFDRKLTDLLRKGVETGEFTISDCGLAALAIGGMASWAYEWYRPGGRLSDKAIGEQLTQLMLTMVGAAEPKAAEV